MWCAENKGVSPDHARRALVQVDDLQVDIEPPAVQTKALYRAIGEGLLAVELQDYLSRAVFAHLPGCCQALPWIGKGLLGLLAGRANQPSGPVKPPSAMRLDQGTSG